MENYKIFVTSKATILLIVLPKDAYDIKISQLIGDRQKIRTRNESMPLPQGNWQLIGKLSEVSEEVAKGLVDDDEIYECYFSGFEKWIDIYKDYNNSEPMPYGVVFTATESLTSIATHLGMELTDNIYLLKKI